MLERPPILLAIGGVDPSGGAGLAMDARAAAGARVVIRPIVSALTVQDSSRVRSVRPVDPSQLKDAIEAALAEGVDVAKTGLLADAATIATVARALPRDLPLVVDPVLRATTGQPLADDAAVAAFASLTSRATLVTPNLAEVQRLTRLDVARDAAWALRKAGAESVLVTDGDGSSDVVRDLLLTATGDEILFDAPRIHGGPWRGTGCALATLCAAHIAQGYDTRDAVQAAIAETQSAIARSFPQRGARFLPEVSSLLSDARAHAHEARGRLASVARAWRSLEPAISRHDVPEVGANLSYLPQDGDVARSAGLSARCVRTGTGVRIAGPVEIGGTHHTARIAAAARSHDPRVRCALNLRYRPASVDAARAAGLTVSSFRREDQPASEPSTVAWGTRVAVEAARRVPDLIYDLDGPGKEPMMRVLGADPPDVVTKALLVLRGGDATAPH